MLINKLLLMLTYIFINGNKLINATIDINLPELQYIADHLTQEECRKLVASLHYNAFKMPDSVEAAERSIQENASCLKLLLHWNSEKGEGLGQTHQVLSHRLRQINRIDLAEWLDKTVFHQLGENLVENLKEPFDELIASSTMSGYGIDPVNIILQEQESWFQFDTILIAIIFSLSILIVYLAAKVIISIYSTPKNKKLKKDNKMYQVIIEDQESGSEQELFSKLDDLEM